MPLSAQSGPTGSLWISAGAGVAFAVTDGAGALVEEGTGERRLKLAEGLYAIEWRTAGERSETLVRIKPGRRAQAQYPPGEVPTEESAAGQPARIVKELLPSERDYGSAIAVVATAEPDCDAVKALGTVRLLDAREKSMRAANTDLPEIQLRAGESARCYRVPPGHYLLSFVAVTGETLQQTVPALRDRRTIVFLQARTGEVLVAVGQKFERKTKTGIDPAHTVILSVRGDETDYRIRERLRLTGVLLSDLAVGSGSLTREFVSILRQKTTDPLLKLAAVIVVISRIGADQSPSLDEPWPVDADAAQAFRQAWLAHAASWLARSRFAQMPPDATVAWWQLDTLGVPGKPTRCPNHIATPPMLTCTWRWAAAQSATFSDAVQTSASIRAATRAAGGTEPWLSWKAAAAKAQPTKLELPKIDIEELARQVASKAISMMRQADKVGKGIRAASDLLDSLSPEASVMTQHLRKMSETADKFGPAVSFAATLAGALAMPRRTLEQRLIRTSNELDTVQAQIESPAPRIANSSGSKARPRAPGLDLAVAFPDDLQRGRFGGQSRKAGFTLSAQFSPTRSREWTRITLIVEGPAEDGDYAEFHLHDSFHPPIERERFKLGRAKHVLTAWGGFTIGLWLPSQKLMLELSLWSLPGAPTNIKTR